MENRIFIEAIRTIRSGEELAYDYQIQRDDDDPQDVDAIFACRCGAQQCRGSMLEAPEKKRKPRRAKPQRARRKRAKPQRAARKRAR